MPYELIAILMFSTMMLMLLTGQRVFGAIGFVAVIAALFLWGDRGGYDIGFSAAIKLMRWYPLLTLPMFIFMGYVLSESKIADDLYKMFHVWMGEFGHSCAAFGRAGALRHDRAPTSRPIVVGGGDTGVDDGCDVHHLYRDTVPNKSRARSGIVA